MKNKTENKLIDSVGGKCYYLLALLLFLFFCSSSSSSSFYSIFRQNSAEAYDNNNYDGRITIEALDEISSRKKNGRLRQIILINANKC